ncbi:hypothetical protein ScPMuIL_006610 [Solemya velum]
MSFQSQNAVQESRNRKILEQLEEQKKRLRMQAHGVGGGTSQSAVQSPVPAQNVVPSGLPMVVDAQNSHMTPAQRTALQHANANSFGYFITQDSSFGNLILPVLPRCEKS